MINFVTTIYKSKIFKHYLERPPVVIGSIVILILLLGAIFAPLIAPQNPYAIDKISLSNSLKPPLWKKGGVSPFILGTDMQGRGVFSTILYGCRTSFLVGISVVIIAGGFGALIGLLAGYYGGILDIIMMRMGDTLFSFSQTLIAMLLLGIFQTNSVVLVIMAICISGWVQYARTIRGEVLSVKEEEYVLASKATGNNDRRIIFKHILPNSISPLLVIAAVHFGMAIMLEATLSFLGVGVPITHPSLGMMISQGRNFLYAGKWWLVFFPGITLMSIVFSLNLIADWLRDEFDPRLKNI
ncbi:MULTISPECIES: ABC transporter permease [unclassified Halanaerobium]|uniref:ABC transporter permease n=1 Tax=unclassified Halanaerobium TaxID=2641197 RepID=UPI000DF328A0|nr:MULTISPECIES: ABC transporter permease [unclassified Halanaerobium]RCW39895.1 peptide/nickel transport system permease protein [Halanaerobium sp. MA284_MarDTE_T2]RCW80755.1 peptide/nickel transport system permease protein [Halanaerobium sp. DL-01]